MALVGADVGALRALARTLSQAADRLDQTNSAVSGGLSNVRWSGPDADRFGAVWQQQSRKSLSSAATALREAAQALQRNAIEQEQASAATGGALSGSAGSGSAMPSIAGPTPGRFSLLDPLVDARDFLNQTPVWPITWGTMLNGAGISGLDLIDALGLAGDTRLDDSQKIIQAGNSATDLLGGVLKKTPAGYLGGVAVQQWGDVVAQAAGSDFSPAGLKTVTNYVAQDPGGAFEAAKGAVLGYVPKLFSNLVPW